MLTVKVTMYSFTQLNSPVLLVDGLTLFYSCVNSRELERPPRRHRRQRRVSVVCFVYGFVSQAEWSQAERQSSRPPPRGQPPIEVSHPAHDAAAAAGAVAHGR